MYMDPVDLLAPRLTIGTDLLGGHRVDQDSVGVTLRVSAWVRKEDGW